MSTLPYVKHVSTHKAKLSKERGDWGYKTFCGKIVDFAHAKPDPKSDMNCGKCLRVYIMKKEEELNQLKNLNGVIYE